MTDDSFSPAHSAALANLLVDAVAIEVIQAFREQAVDAVLLKGRSIADWLYGEDESRSYVDADVLIRRPDWARAEGVLSSLGFERQRDASWIQGWTNPAQPWFRSRDSAVIDLHVSLPGVGVGPDGLWNVLAGELEPMTIGGAQVMVLSPPARALHLALHVTQHEGSKAQPSRDLELAVERLDAASWASTAELARRLRATPALTLGLESVPAGAERARGLGLPSRGQARRGIQTTRLDESLRALRQAPSFGARAQMLASKALPSPSLMRTWSPLARRGPLGLALAYAWRPVWLLGRALVGVRGRRSRSP